MKSTGFRNETKGGYFFTTEEHPSIILRLKEASQDSEPPGNSIPAESLSRLAACFDRNEFKNRATRIFLAFSKVLMRFPAMYPQLVSASVLYRDGMTQIYIAGQRDAKDTADLLGIVHRRLIPRKVLILVDHKNPDNNSGKTRFWTT